ncbi:lipid-A-disaccharide synthase, partial [Thioalkalivibrio halophilus]
GVTAERLAGLAASPAAGGEPGSEPPLDYVGEEDGTHAIMADADLLLTASGTATLEAGLLRAPMLVFYRMGAVSHLVFRRLVHLEHIALVNIVAEEGVVPEYLQHDATPQRLAEDADALLREPERLEAMRERLSRVRERLGDGGADRRVAAAAAEMLEHGHLLPAD